MTQWGSARTPKVQSLASRPWLRRAPGATNSPHRKLRRPGPPGGSPTPPPLDFPFLSSSVSGPSPPAACLGDRRLRLCFPPRFHSPHVILCYCKERSGARARGARTYKYGHPAGSWRTRGQGGPGTARPGGPRADRQKDRQSASEPGSRRAARVGRGGRVPRPNAEGRVWPARGGAGPPRTQPAPRALPSPGRRRSRPHFSTWAPLACRGIAEISPQTDTMAAAAATTTAACSSSSSGGGGGGTDAGGTSGLQQLQQQPQTAAAAPAQPPLPPPPPEPPRKPRMDPRRRQAALSFLTNISLDGRPPLPDEECSGSEESGGAKPGAGSACSARTRLSMLAVAERGGCNVLAAAGTALGAALAAGSGACLPQPSPLPALAPGGHATVPGLGTARGFASPLGAGRTSGEQWQPSRPAPFAACAQLQLPDGQEELEEDDAFTSVQVPSPIFLGSGTPGSGGGSRGRLNSFTQGILPIAFSRQTSQNYCSLEQPGQGASTSAFEQLQRSR